MLSCNGFNWIQQSCSGATTNHQVLSCNGFNWIQQSCSGATTNHQVLSCKRLQRHSVCWQQWLHQCAPRAAIVGLEQISAAMRCSCFVNEISALQIVGLGSHQQCWTMVSSFQRQSVSGTVAQDFSSGVSGGVMAGGVEPGGISSSKKPVSSSKKPCTLWSESKS